TDDPNIADTPNNTGYATGQFGKNHLGDKDEIHPTKHGFDEFFGNLYHLNAEEEPENPDYPKDPAFKKKFGPRGVIHSYADGKVEDTGPLTKKRMETVDEEFLAAAMDFMDRQHKANKPFFCWFNSTRMHVLRISSPNPMVRPALVFIPTAWSSTTDTLANYLRSWKTSGFWITRSSFTPPTTALRSSPGQMAAPRPIEGRKQQGGKVDSACLV